MQSHPRVSHLQIRYIFNVNPLPIVFARYVDDWMSFCIIIVEFKRFVLELMKKLLKQEFSHSQNPDM
jgi:hypothetical protein